MLEMHEKKIISSCPTHIFDSEGTSVIHTSATLMYKYGHVDIRSLQQILGHESIATTEIYTHVDDNQLHAAVNANPLAMMFN